MLSARNVGDTKTMDYTSKPNLSPGTMVGSTFSYDDDNIFLNGSEDDLNIEPDFFFFEDDGLTGPEEHVPFLTPNLPTTQFQKFPFSTQTQLDFTSFLERLDSSTDKEMMQLIARYFHDRISVFRNNVKIFNIPEEINPPSQPNNLLGATPSDNQIGTRVVVAIDLEEKSSPRLVRDFIEDADDLLDNREDLKIALRAVFPPTIAASGFSDPIFSSPLSPSRGRKRRKAARNNRISATIAALYGNDDFDDYERRRDKKFRKRGRPRKNTILSSDGNSTAPNRVEGSSVKSTSSDLEKKNIKKKKESSTDDEWRPEKKRLKGYKKNESPDSKKANKLKSPSDKAKEEADLASMGVENLEKHIYTLQQQMRNVKHKHRKGTICPRCTTEQRLKLAFKAKNRAQCELKIPPRTTLSVPVRPTQPHSVSLVPMPTTPRPVKKEIVQSTISKPVTRESAALAAQEKNL